MRDDARFRILRLISDRPEMSQRELAEALGLSLGGVNFCMKGLVERGMVKVRNFRKSGNKLAYAYFLTPQGASEKAALTRAFLERRMAEYQALKAEIEALEAEVGTADAGR
ncbi:EPS-associated MarR family transcriptional regulator [Silicimonas algicola]|uniref:EPS-associated MarR family transcriptional regulator n=2 Tax=Silicimonas algicola TaxID=1826607 RepID=A0A316FZZ5_9RHOB|nr:EPS-associated MarR family transcriptional regulator [Silicimonas algicola]